jgi:hypothetical protein
MRNIDLIFAPSFNLPIEIKRLLREFLSRTGKKLAMYKLTIQKLCFSYGGCIGTVSTAHERYRTSSSSTYQGFHTSWHQPIGNIDHLVPYYARERYYKANDTFFSRFGWSHSLQICRDEILFMTTYREEEPNAHSENRICVTFKMP